MLLSESASKTFEDSVAVLLLESVPRAFGELVAVLLSESASRTFEDSVAVLLLESVPRAFGELVAVLLSESGPRAFGELVAVLLSESAPRAFEDVSASSHRFHVANHSHSSRPKKRKSRDALSRRPSGRDRSRCRGPANRRRYTRP